MVSGPTGGEIGRHPAQHAGLAEPPGPEEGGEPVVHQPLGQVGDQLVPPDTWGGASGPGRGTGCGRSLRR